MVHRILRLLYTTPSLNYEGRWNAMKTFSDAWARTDALQAIYQPAPPQFAATRGYAPRRSQTRDLVGDANILAPSAARSLFICKRISPATVSMTPDRVAHATYHGRTCMTGRTTVAVPPHPAFNASLTLPPTRKTLYLIRISAAISYMTATLVG